VPCISVLQRKKEQEERHGIFIQPLLLCDIGGFQGAKGAMAPELGAQQVPGEAVWRL